MIITLTVFTHCLLLLELQSLEQQLSRDAISSRESLANDLVQVMETVQQPVKSRANRKEAKTGVIFQSYRFYPTCNSPLSATVTHIRNTKTTKEKSRT